MCRVLGTLWKWVGFQMDTWRWRFKPTLLQLLESGLAAFVRSALSAECLPRVLGSGHRAVTETETLLVVQVTALWRGQKAPVGSCRVWRLGTAGWAGAAPESVRAKGHPGASVCIWQPQGGQCGRQEAPARKGGQTRGQRAAGQ